MICVQSQLWWNPRLRAYDTKGILKWSEKTKNLYVWEYYNFPQHRKDNLFPGFSIHRFSDNIKLYKKLGIKGMFIELDYTPVNFSWTNPVQDQINLYFTLKLLDDADVNIDTLLNEFYSAFYGKAGEPIKQFVMKAENIYNSTEKYPTASLNTLTHLNSELSWKYLCPPDSLKQFSKLIEDAYRLARTDIEKNRVKLFDEAVHQMMLKSSAAYFQNRT